MKPYPTRVVAVKIVVTATAIEVHVVEAKEYRFVGHVAVPTAIKLFTGTKRNIVQFILQY